MKKRGKINSIAIFTLLISIAFVSSFSVSPTIPTSIALNCDSTYNQEFIITPGSGESISVTPQVVADDNMQMALTFYPTTNHFYLSFFHTSVCSVGNRDFSFKINESVYNIKVNVTENLTELDSVSVSEGKFLDVGGEVEFNIVSVGLNKVSYSYKCLDDSEIDDGVLDVGESLDLECNNENFKFTLENSFEDLNTAIIKVFSSESGYSITRSDSVSNSDCVLGLDTLGAKVKRGNIFAIKTINANTNSYVGNVGVTIIDQAGEVSAISGTSSNIGFFSERLFEEYSQDLVVQLEKEGCEPYTNVILFENTYSDYKDEKEQIKQETTLQLTLSSNFIVNNEISGTVKNLLNEGIDTAKIKVTKPDETTFEITTTEAGTFKFTPEQTGIYKLQASKSSYTPSELYTFESISGEYDIIPYVEGRKVSSFSNGDLITFELRDDNDSIVKLNVEANYGNDKVKFTEGVSEQVEFVSGYNLIVPETNGYQSQDYKTKKKENQTQDIIKWGLIIGGILIVLVLIVKLKGKKSPNLNKMDVQLGVGGN